MKPVKSVVLLAAGALILSACDMNKKNNETSSTDFQNTTRSAGETAFDSPPANATGTTVTSDQGSTIGAGAAPAEESENLPVTLDQSSTSEGSGAVSPDAASDENLNNQNFDDDEITDEVEEQQSIPTSSEQGTGVGDDYEYVDETSSEPNGVRGGRDGRMVSRNNEVDNTSSEPDIDR